MTAYINELNTEDVYREIKARLKASGYTGPITVEMLNFSRVLLKYKV